MTIILLLFVPLASAFSCALLPRGRQSTIEYLSFGAAALELVLALAIIRAVILHGMLAAGELFAVDALGAFILLFTALVGFAAAMHSIGHLRGEMHKDIIGFSRVREYYALFHLFFFAMFAAAMTASPIIMWVAIEATTLATAFLITFYNKPSALEAGWKHLIVNSVGLLIGFLGTLLFLNAAAVAGAAGTFVSWTTLHALSPSFDPNLIKMAFIFVLVGYGTKVGFVPMHTWLPDAHSKAPVPISSLLSGVLLNVALIAVLRFRSVADAVLDPSFTQHLLILFGAVSILLAALIIFAQKNYKRMLAYSSIENMGVLGLGFGIGGMASVAALFHMLYHALLKPILFFCAGNFFLKYSSTRIERVRGALTLVPFTSIVFLGALFSIAGAPPSGIFFTKLAILSAGMRLYPWIMMIALLAFVIVFAGFIKHAMNMLFGKPPEDIPAGEALLRARLRQGEAGNWTLVSLGFLSVIFIVLSVWIPGSLSALVDQAALLIT